MTRERKSFLLAVSLRKSGHPGHRTAPSNCVAFVRRKTRKLNLASSLTCACARTSRPLSPPPIHGSGRANAPPCEQQTSPCGRRAAGNRWQDSPRTPHATRESTSSLSILRRERILDEIGARVLYSRFGTLPSSFFFPFGVSR